MQSRGIIIGLIAFVLYLLAIPALLFVSAGTVNWPMAWVYTGLLIVATIGSRWLVYLRNPDTLRERAASMSGQGAQRWDRGLVLGVGLLGPVVLAIVAGLDHRGAWSGMVPAVVQYVAAVLVAGGYGLGVWAMVENRFFSAVARIQADRGQQVVATGPYRIVRHPSYTGAILASLALPVMLSALWALIPAVAIGILVTVRTSLEDRMLRNELAGYEAYANETPYRLVPGIW